MILPLICALYALPGPPSVQIQNGTYQAYSINRKICPIDPKRESIFELYTRKNPLEPQILLTEDQNSIQSSNMNFTNPTMIFFHGFLESSQSDNAVQLRNSYLKLGDYNVILCNNQRLLAGPDYITSAGNVLPIGQFSARFVDYLVDLGLNLKTLHIIGMSLGGQIAGLTGKHMKSGKARRLTGLDPAGPIFSLLPQDQRIGPDDAEFVDVIHTNAGINGININSGKVDVWFNGGSKQPGCSIKEILERNPGSLSEQVFCNHYQAYRVYVKSILEPKIYTLTECSSYDKYKNGACDSNNKIYMGEEMDETARGTYYIKTNVTAVDI